MYAARENCLECVNVLLKHHVDVDLPDPDGVAPVTVAIMNRNWDIARRLIEAGADVNQWDMYGQGPLYAAVVASAAPVIGLFGGGPTNNPLDPPNRRPRPTWSPCCWTRARTSTCSCSIDLPGVGLGALLAGRHR